MARWATIKKLFELGSQVLPPWLEALYEDWGGVEHVVEGELRKVQCTFSRLSKVGVTDDYAIVTFHLVKLVDDDFSTTWETTDYTNAEANLDAFFSTYAAYLHSSVTMAGYRWYKAGPAYDVVGVVNPAQRVTVKSIPGTHAGTNGTLPPQCAISVTEKTLSRLQWGRWYMPAPTASTSAIAANGRVGSTLQVLLADAAQTLYDAMDADNLLPVVYSKKHKSVLTVNELQVDDVYDVIRTRRWRDVAVREIRDGAA